MSNEAIPNIDPEISNKSYLRDSMWLLCFLSDDNLEVLFAILLHPPSLTIGREPIGRLCYTAGPPRSLLRQNSSSGALLGSASDSGSSCSGVSVRSTTAAAAAESASDIPVRSTTTVAAAEATSGVFRRAPSRPAGTSRRDGGTANVRPRLGGGLVGHCGLHSGLIPSQLDNAGRSIDNGRVVKANLFGDGVPFISMTLERTILLNVAVGKLLPASGDQSRKWCLITLVTGVLAASSSAVPNAC